MDIIEKYLLDFDKVLAETNTLRRRKPNYTSMGTDYSEAATAVCRGFFVIMRTYRELCELIKTYRNR